MKQIYLGFRFYLNNLKKINCHFKKKQIKSSDCISETVEMPLRSSDSNLVGTQGIQFKLIIYPHLPEIFLNMCPSLSKPTAEWSYHGISVAAGSEQLPLIGLQHIYKFHCTPCTHLTAHSTRHTANCPLPTAHFACHTVQCTLHTSHAHYTLHPPMYRCGTVGFQI